MAISIHAVKALRSPDLTPAISERRSLRRASARSAHATQAARRPLLPNASAAERIFKLETALCATISSHPLSARLVAACNREPDASRSRASLCLELAAYSTHALSASRLFRFAMEAHAPLRRPRLCSSTSLNSSQAFVARRSPLWRNALAASFMPRRRAA